MNQIIEMPEDGLPLTHTFSDGVYAREIFMPKGMIVIGHVHRTKHLNIVSTGKARVFYDGEMHEITAPYTFESEAGVRKALFILEDMFWTTIHVTDETNQDKLDDILIDKNASEGISIESLLNKADKQLLIGG